MDEIDQDDLEAMTYQLLTDLMLLGQAIVAGEKVIVIEKHTIHHDQTRSPVIEHRVVVR